MTTIGISQPTYLPWLGYFDLIDQVDQFVLLDSVQFERHSWQHRNRVKGPAGEIALVVPVKRTGLETTIRDATIASPRELVKHRKTIEQAYARASHREELLARVQSLLDQPPDRLVGLTIPIIETLMDVLGIDTTVHLASSLSASGNKDYLVRAICDELGGDSYLAAPGSRPYLADGDAFSDGAVNVRYHQFEVVEYGQLYPPFIGYLSVVDVIMCEGPRGARDVMLEGRRPPTE